MAQNKQAFGMIRNDELPIWIDVLSNDCFDHETGELSRPAITDPHEMLQRINLINDLLILQKNQCLLTRKRGLKDQLMARIGKDMGFETFNLNTKK